MLYEVITQLSSRRNVWEMQPDGSYIAREETTGKAARSSQETFIELA